MRQRLSAAALTARYHEPQIRRIKKSAPQNRSRDVFHYSSMLLTSEPANCLQVKYARESQEAWAREATSEEPIISYKLWMLALFYCISITTTTRRDDKQCLHRKIFRTVRHSILLDHETCTDIFRHFEIYNYILLYRAQQNNYKTTNYSTL